MAYNYLKCRLDLDISEDDTEKLGVHWSDVTFLTASVDGKVGEFLIRSNGQFCHKSVEMEKVPASKASESGVIWGGTGYCRIAFMDWKGLPISEKITVNTTILGKDADADVEIKFEVNSGYVVRHEVTKFELIDNAPRKKHDTHIKELAIKRAKKMNTKGYRLYDCTVRKPLTYICRAVRYTGSFIQDFTWKLERKLHKK
jgi:hypothetical protein